MDALYALAREADDLVDSPGPVEKRRLALAEFRDGLEAALAGRPSGPLLPAVADAAQRFAIPHEHLLDLLDGVAMDLDPQSPATFADLYGYCYRVASVVGLACLPIWGCRDERAMQPAIDCGIAFQLTNILRDLAEDASGGRCYLPRDELVRFGLVAGEEGASRWLPRAWTQPLAELVQFQIARARSYYESAEDTSAYLPAPGRRVFHLMLARYRSLLTSIEGDPPGVLRGRVALSWPRKLLVAVRALWSGVRGQESGVRSQGPGVRGQEPGVPSVAVVGGGLAGLAAAAALCQRGVSVELFEARQRLGGRAGSYVDRTSGELVDHCQHVAMGCCTSFLDFCRQTGIDGLCTRHQRLHFFGPDGQRCDFHASPLLPAPLHLARALWRQTYLSRADRWSIAQALLRLAREPARDEPGRPTVAQWLARQQQSPAAIERFWQVVLVSALGESLDRASLAAARKVFVDGFLSSRQAYEVITPQVSLGELYDVRVADWLRQRGVNIHLGTPVEEIAVARVDACPLLALRACGMSRGFDAVIVAVPWQRLPDIVAPELAARLASAIEAARAIESSPITGIHLWFDRRITDLPHAVIVGRLVQWVFARNQGSGVRGQESGIAGHHYQIVISASRQLAGRTREDVLAEVLADLHAVMPNSRAATLTKWQMISDPHSVFSVCPGLSQIRPPQSTAAAGLFLAGDWTTTNWPATMEGAVRSGYLAAEALLASFGRRQKIVAPELPRSWLARWLVRDP